MNAQDKTEECEYCDGTGRVPNFRPVQPNQPKPMSPPLIECEHCKGVGQIPRTKT